MTGSGYHYNLGLKFYKIADTFSDNIAFKYPSDEMYTYREVNILSNKIACYLLKKAVDKGDVVAVFNEKSHYAYSLMLACLKIGAIYTNLDTSSPWARLHKILNTCQPKIIFLDQERLSLKTNLAEHFSGTGLIELFDEEFKLEVDNFEDQNLDETVNVNGSDPAYIMFTSGSTGFPKGAVMSHSNVLNFIDWGRQTFGVNETDIFTNANPVYFDNSVFDFYISIFNGATLVPIGHELAKSPKQLVEAINQSRCTVWFSVPSLLVYLLSTRALSKSDFTTVKRMSFGGEGFPKNKLQQLYQLFGDRMTLFNVYGPTECTCICSSYIISERDFDNMSELAPLGHIAPNFGYEILPLDENNQNIGELALLGPCVGLGYYNDFSRTASSFVQNEKSCFTQIMYKTGDLVEIASNGYLHFKGRIDNQVKHMGYRIELEEVEAAFSSLTYVNEVGVVYEKLTPELGQIKAFVSLGDTNKDDKNILADIKNLLPPYMVPRVVAILPILPKNSNGKIDRKQLAELK